MGFGPRGRDRDLAIGPSKPRNNAGCQSQSIMVQSLRKQAGSQPRAPPASSAGAKTRPNALNRARSGMTSGLKRAAAGLDMEVPVQTTVRHVVLVPEHHRSNPGSKLSGISSPRISSRERPVSRMMASSPGHPPVGLAAKRRSGVNCWSSCCCKEARR